MNISASILHQPPLSHSQGIKEDTVVINNDIFTSIFSYLLKEDRDKIAQPNLIIGENGSGKTSLLKRMYFSVENSGKQLKPVFIEGMIGFACLLAHVGCLTCDASRYTGSASSFIGLCWSFGDTTSSPGAAVSVTVPDSESTTTYFENCRFYNMGTKSQNGGAVYINGKGTHEFHFCEFNNVQGGGSGGAICAENIWNVVVDTCIFDKVQALKGGALYFTMTTDTKTCQVSGSQFVDCIVVEESFYGEVYKYDGAVAYFSPPPASAVKVALAECTFENCSISYSQTEPLAFLSCIYLELTTTESPVTFQDCVFNGAGNTYEEYYLKILECQRLLLKNNTFNQVKITGTNPLLKPDEACKSLEVLDCDFQTVTSACDGSVVDSQGITSVTLDNCSFGSCSATETTSGGVVVVSAGTGECQVIDCKFVANSCDKGVHSLRIISTSFVNLTRCTFSGHTGSLPVLLADGGSALQSTNDFLINDCVFNDNSLSDITGVIVFPTDKSVQFDRCTFTNNQASVTLTKCSKMSFDFCFFTVSGDATVPVIRDNGTPELQITGCSFAHTGTEPEGGSTYQYVVIENEKCNAVISQNCFSSDNKNAIQLPSGANVGNGNEFGAECQEPWNPPEQPGSSGNTDPEVPPPASSDPILNDEFPYGPVIGGVIGGIAVIAVLAILIFFFVVRRKRQPTQTESDNNSEYLAHSDGVAA